MRGATREGSDTFRSVDSVIRDERLRKNIFQARGPGVASVRWKFFFGFDRASSSRVSIIFVEHGFEL